ncbi:tumor rejection antigen P815A-like [Peromyscus californicus insignis]|uniref:tumor rejection antigen P815A-like n=1 Tax=Peromyscus californicus insignis TaxID=564181 RepID=UPI0022A68F91|nr:tumor rejection antigen P815A-like [Peromyscus californicus insignis]
MSDTKKPDRGHSGSNGEDDGNRSLEEILMSLQWLIFIAATAGFLAFQLITNAIYEEQYEGDVAWISNQSRQMSPTDEEDEDIEDEDIEDEDEDEEELENQMEAEEVGAENEMLMEESAGAPCLTDLATCTCEFFRLKFFFLPCLYSPGVPNNQLRKKEFKCPLFYFFRDPKFMVPAPFKSEKPNECECENAAEQAAGEEEEEDDETGELARESKKNLDSAEGSPP